MPWLPYSTQILQPQRQVAVNSLTRVSLLQPELEAVGPPKKAVPLERGSVRAIGFNGIRLV